MEGKGEKYGQKDPRDTCQWKVDLETLLIALCVCVLHQTFWGTCSTKGRDVLPSFLAGTFYLLPAISQFPARKAWACMTPFILNREGLKCQNAKTRKRAKMKVSEQGVGLERPIQSKTHKRQTRLHWKVPIPGNRCARERVKRLIKWNINWTSRCEKYVISLRRYVCKQVKRKMYSAHEARKEESVTVQKIDWKRARKYKRKKN